MNARTFALTAAAMLAFAGNTLLCRAALGIVLLAEPLSLRLVSASIATIGGVAIVIAGRTEGTGAGVRKPTITQKPAD